MKVLFIVLPIIILIGMGVWGFFSFIKLKKIVEEEKNIKNMTDIHNKRLKRLGQ